MDEAFTRIALELAAQNPCGNGGPFGALIVLQGKAIAQGQNRVIIDKDPTAHAEIVAIRAACAKLGQFHLEGGVLYASSEPCPMCLAAAYWARIERIVFANPRQVAADIGFCDDDLYRELALPPPARRIPARHLVLPDADLPLKQWCGNPRRVSY